MKNLLLILAVLLIPVVAFAEEKVTARENKTAPASAKKGKVKEKCVIPKLEHEEKLPSGETVTIKDPIPDNLSDKCYCKAVNKKYINYKTASPTINSDVYFYMKDREFKCLLGIPPEYQSRILTKDERRYFLEKAYGFDFK